jgi:hypothetical protein
MTRKFKALSLALIAVFAMSALGAAAAQAENVTHTFKSDSPNGKTDLTGFQEGKHVFTINGTSEEPVSTECASAKFEGTEVGEELDKLTVVPTYDECETSLGAAEVIENHCAYEFGSDTTTHTNPAGVHAAVKVECVPNNTIEINVPGVGVTVKVGEQEDLHGVRYVNKEENEVETVTVEATVRNIAWTCSPAFICGLGGIPSSGTDGTYDGNTEVTGYRDDGGELGETAKTTPTLSHSLQVPITVTTP